MVAVTGKLTRRELAVVLSAPALVAQTPAPPLPQNADDELTAARNQNRQASEQLAKFPLPMDTEPAVHFKA
jgi:hypothetical protein